MAYMPVVAQRATVQIVREHTGDPIPEERKDLPLQARAHATRVARTHIVRSF